MSINIHGDCWHLEEALSKFRIHIFYFFPSHPSLPVAEEERLSRELPDTPGGYGQPPIDVGVVRVRGVVWHKVSRSAGETIAL